MRRNRQIDIDKVELGNFAEHIRRILRNLCRRGSSNQSIAEAAQDLLKAQGGYTKEEIDFVADCLRTDGYDQRKEGFRLFD